MIKCPNCGKRNPNDNKFCGECGTNLSEAEMQCPNCEKIHKDGEKFCTNCGTKLVTPTEYIILKNEERDLFYKELSESLDDVSTRVLADEMRVDNWIYISKEDILDDLLRDYSYEEINFVRYNLPSEKIETFKLFFELDDESIQELTYFMPSEYQKRKISKEQIFEYILKNNDLEVFKQKIIASIVPSKSKDSDTKNILITPPYKQVKYEMVKELFKTHPMQTDILLKEVCEHFNLIYTSNIEAISDLSKNYSVPQLIKTIRDIEEKNARNNMEQVKELIVENSIQNEPLVRGLCGYLRLPYNSYYKALSLLCSYNQDELKEAINIVEKRYIEEYGSAYKKSPRSSKKKSNNKSGILGRFFG